MSKVETIFAKCMTYVICAMLMLTVFASGFGILKVSAEGDTTTTTESQGDTTTTEGATEDAGALFDGAAEVGNAAYTTEDPSKITVLNSFNRNFTAGLVTGSAILLGTAGPTNDPEVQARIYEATPYASIIGNGLVGNAGGMVTMALNNYPAGITPATYMVESWSPSRANEVYAVTSWTDSLSPIYPLWEFMTGVAYTLFILVVIAIGFMIMFRQRIGGQIAVSITNALPRVLIGMLATHLSFFFASVILGLGTFLMGVFASMLQSSGLANPIEIASPLSVWGVRGFVLGATALGGGGDLGPLWDLGKMGVPIISDIASNLSLMFSGGGDNVAWGLGSIIIKLVLAIGLLYASFRIFFNLISAYVRIFIKVITLPIVTVFGSLPGQEAMIFNSYKGLLIDSLIFPVTFLLINLGILIAAYSMPDLGGSPITFPQLGGNTIIYEESGGNIAGFIAYGVIVSAASADIFIKEMLQFKDSESMKNAIGRVSQTLSKTPLIGNLAKGVME